MSEAAVAPAEGGVGSGAPAEGAAAQIIESGAVDSPADKWAKQQTETVNAIAPNADPIAPPADVQRSEHNRRLIEAERLRRKVEKERAEVERMKREAEAAREEAKRAAEQRNGEADQMATLMREARGNPAKFQALLEATGLTLDDYVKWRVSDGEVSPEQQIKGLDAALRDEIKAAREEIAALKKARDEELQQREQQAAAQQRAEAVAYFQGEIKKTLETNPEKYELTIAAGDEGEVFDLIDRAWRERKVALTAEQAADLVEKFHRDRAERFAKTKFYSSKFQPQSEAAPQAPAGKPAPTAKPNDAKAKSASPTAMTNNVVTSPVTPDDDVQPLISREEFLEKIAKPKVASARKATADTRK